MRTYAKQLVLQKQAKQALFMAVHGDQIEVPSWFVYHDHDYVSSPINGWADVYPC